jgi:uncharacterized protein YaiE (UPF0345 family)
MDASGSVQATDGSTITWTTAGDTVTASGSDGRQMAIKKLAYTAPNNGVRITFSDSGGQYFQLGRTQLQMGSGLGAYVGATGAFGSPRNLAQITMTDLGNAAGAITHVVVLVDGKNWTWAGRVPLTDTPTRLLDQTGWVAAVEQPIAKANYFGPAAQAIIPQTIIGPTLSTAAAAPDAEGVGLFFGKATIACIGAVVTAWALAPETGGLSLYAAGVACFGTSSVEMATDLAEQMAQGAASDGGGCFGAGTVVATAGDGLCPIERVESGVLVASRDELSRADGNRRVQRTWTHRDKPAIDLRLASGEIIRTTTVHRVFTEDGRVVPVGDLGSGARLLTLSCGPVAIEEMTAVRGAVTVHNLTIDDYHTYFVGETGVWVHNDKICIDVNNPGNVIVITKDN